MTGEDGERAPRAGPGNAAGEVDPLSRMARGGAAMGAEMAAFAVRRMRAADSARRRMLGARSMAEIGAVQAGYVQEAAADYLRHLAVLNDLGTRAVRGAMAAGAPPGASGHPAPPPPAGEVPEATPAKAPAKGRRRGPSPG